MFKIESYITPLILSYVEKYIKNFRPEDSQVSLWGGDVSFHNLDLRLEVLEQELQLPFSFVSGHIHELLIHVPWTKLTSEPIHITINTIECILKLRGEDSTNSDTSSHLAGIATGTKDGKRKSKRQDVVAPPGYVQSVVNKIISNITILCNNLILKYVEEDIVLSVNVKTVTLQSANKKWEPEFTEFSPLDVLLRKLINLSDLTICLDKRNASGKIEMYQEPLLYRCSMEIHLVRSYCSAGAKRAATTRVDVLCGRMDFSLTEQQVPMLMRLVRLALALHGRELRPEAEQERRVSAQTRSDSLGSDSSEEQADADVEESWAGWVWSWVPAVVPLNWDEENWFSEQHTLYQGHTVHAGFYVEQASISLKVTECTSERSYYGPRKVKFVPFLALQLQGCRMDCVMHGSVWLNVQVGVSYISLEPCGDCFCGAREPSAAADSKDAPQDSVYFTAGSEQKNFLRDSLFDPEAVENRGDRKQYHVSWECHITTYTESLLLEKTPALAVDYVYHLELPEDFTSERLSELGSDLEYSNLGERWLCRAVLGPSSLRLGPGLGHRLAMILHAARLYDYLPYGGAPHPVPSRDQLPPPAADDFDALEANIPLQVLQATAFQVSVTLQLTDHPAFDPATFQGTRRRRKPSRQTPQRTSAGLTFSCQCLDTRLVQPLYPRRLVTTVCQLPEAPGPMFEACHTHITARLLGVSGALRIGLGRPTTLLVPGNCSIKLASLLMPEYWLGPELAHVDHTISAESLTLATTKAKLMVALYILQCSLGTTGHGSDLALYTTLLDDAAQDRQSAETLELCVEGLCYRRVVMPATEAHSLRLSSVRAFVLQGGSGAQQALVLSGPEGERDDLLNATLQLPTAPHHLPHAPILVATLKEVCVCVDPLLLCWLSYSPQPLSDTAVGSALPLASEVQQATGTSSAQSRKSRRLSSSEAATPRESVHSSSDRELQPAVLHPAMAPPVLPETRSIPGQEAVLAWWSPEKVLDWYPVWRSLVLCVDIAPFVVYVPTSTLSAVGARSVEDALQHCMKGDSPVEVLVMKLPLLTLRSAAQRQDLCQYTSSLPVQLPESVWMAGKVSFPWSLTLSHLSCYTIQNDYKLHFLKAVSANATVGISTKYQTDQQTLSSLGLCVHVDTTPMEVSVSEEQVQLMAGLIIELLDALSSLDLSGSQAADTPAGPSEPVTPASPGMFRESSATPTSPRDDTDETAEERQSATKGDSAVKMSIWMQSTLARLTVSLYTRSSPFKTNLACNHDLKLVLDMEDIMTSLDLSHIYLKVKCKVASASIQHYRRSHRSGTWHTGAYLGLVMRGLEDTEPSPPISQTSLVRDLEEGGGFLSVTFTRALGRHVHERWGAKRSAVGQPERRMSEVVVRLQAVDVVFSPVTLRGFLAVLQPAMLLLSSQSSSPASQTDPWVMRLNSSSLPLIHMDTRGARLIFPAADLTEMGRLHDVCMIQLDNVTLSPQADNPLGRTMVRPDIYHMAEQAHILHVPGSEVEDRQYQLEVRGLSVSTGTWRELDRCLSAGVGSQRPTLRTMSENPALEWNNLVRGRESITPHVALLPVVAPLALCIVMAPAIVYKDSTLVCGVSLEVNATTDIQVSVSTKQLLLASALFTELIWLLEPLLRDGHTSLSRSSLGVGHLPPRSDEKDYSKLADSGVDCADCSSASTQNMLNSSKQSHSVPQDAATISSMTTVMSSSIPDDRSAAPHHSRTYSAPTRTTVEFEEGKRHAKNLKQQSRHSVPRRTIVVPVEILFTAGTVTGVLYETLDSNERTLRRLTTLWRERIRSRLSERLALLLEPQQESDTPSTTSEDGSSGIEEDVDPYLKKGCKPLVHVLLAQPHTFISRTKLARKVQLSCFDVSASMSLANSCPSQIPKAEDFPVVLLETKGGDPHPETGIPPSFVTVRWTRDVGRSAHCEVELGRPTKVYVSITRIRALQNVCENILDCFQEEPEEVEVKENDYTSSVCRPSWREPMPWHTDSGRMFSERISTIDEEKQATHPETSERDSSVGKHSSDRDLSPCGSLAVPGIFLMVSAISLSSQQLVLALEGTSGAELLTSVSGLRSNASRTMRPDRVTLSASLSCLTVTTTSCGDADRRLLLHPWSCSVELGQSWEPWLPPEAPPQVQVTAESDLALLDVGPRQLVCVYTLMQEYLPLLPKSQQEEMFVAESAELPPGLDQHYRDDLRAGAFQYVNATGADLPLPYQVAFWGAAMAWRYPQPRALTRVDVFPVPFKASPESGEVHCHLELWSECCARYQPVTHFPLSESEARSLELPQSTVASVWRVRVTHGQSDYDEQRGSLLSPRVLAACMRVDSFFSPRLVPRLQAAFTFGSIQVALYNHITASQTMPSVLRSFVADGLLPESHCFSQLSFEDTLLYVCQWNSPKGSSTVELSGLARCDVVDYAHLTQQCVVEPFRMHVSLSSAGPRTDLSCVSKPICVRFGPAVGHSLAVSAQLWAQALHNFRSDGGSPESSLVDDSQVIVSRYVICNDSTRVLRFGQTGTDEDILLASRQCHFYAWRSHKAKQLLRAGTEEGTWVWSRPFSIDIDGTQTCEMSDCGTRSISVIVTVASLSTTQKKVTISGQFVLSNMLVEPFECRVISVSDDDSKQRQEECFVLLGKSTPPSVILDTSCKMVFRIRFQGLESAWSGDIPLKENTKSGQPWLVKVPLQDRGQFLSVWCHVVSQEVKFRGCWILAVLCPLYTIRSHLPLPATVLVDTPGLKVHLEAELQGRGEEQQLYCPGTLDHSHKLTFQLQHGVLPSNPYVPLSYTMVDQRKLLKTTAARADVEAVLASLDQQGPKWPYLGPEYNGIEWMVAEQPETHVQVRYDVSNPHTSTLMVDLCPWALLVNTLGQPVTLMVDNVAACVVPHLSVVTPPKLDGTFHLALMTPSMEGSLNQSPPLQFARPDWGTSFYMPRIAGSIPITGNVPVAVQCDTSVALCSLSSDLVNEMRVVNVRAAFVACNNTPLELQVALLAVRDGERWTSFSDRLDTCCTVLLAPYSDTSKNRGVPLVHWIRLYDGDGEVVPYVTFSLGNGWSCPLRLTGTVVRKGFTVPTCGKSIENQAFLLTTQEKSGQIFVSVHVEKHPQITVHNMCRFALRCAQGLPDGEGQAVPETSHFEWWCRVEPCTSAHYNMPILAERFPELLSQSAVPQLVLSLANADVTKEGGWSSGVSVMETQDQFVRLPTHGDVKVRVEIQLHTTHLTVETVSHVEISARDIRSRLLRRDSNPEQPPDDTAFQRQSSVITTCDQATCVPVPSVADSSDMAGDLTVNSVPTTTDTAISSAPTPKLASCACKPMPGVAKARVTYDLMESCIPVHGIHHDAASNKLDLEAEDSQFHVSCFLQGLQFTLIDDLPKTSAEQTEIIMLSLDNIGITLDPKPLSDVTREMEICITITDLQLDNQMFQRGGFDFPVILVGQENDERTAVEFSLNSTARKLIEQAATSALIRVTTTLELIGTTQEHIQSTKHQNVSIGPLCAYIEDTLITRLSEHLACLSPASLIYFPSIEATPCLASDPERQPHVPVPLEVYWHSVQLANPVRLRTLSIDPLSLLISVHTSVKLYIALDRSPLQFSKFERQRICTTPYRLGHTLTMHYLYGAIFGAGWMVGSLELLGSPGGLARTVGTGLRDFVNLPYQGILHGPWGFLVGVTHGSASLMKHVTAGTLSSVTKLAASVARNLDRLTLDEEHLQRTEELRRQRPQGVTQGLLQGLTGLGISLLGAVGGIAHHPLQSVMSQGASTRGLVVGVGRGLVGVITKPLSGAADLVALTGQGLLYDAGWTTQPDVRQQPVIEHTFSGTNSRLKYSWKLVTGLASGRHSLLYVTEATCIAPSGSYEAVALVLTTRALFLVNTEADVMQRVLALAELSGLDHPTDPTLLCFQFQLPGTTTEMDTRVVDFVRQSTSNVVNFTTAGGTCDEIHSDQASSTASASPIQHELPSFDTPLTFYVNPQSRNYFLSLLALAKKQSQGRGFPVL